MKRYTALFLTLSICLVLPLAGCKGGAGEYRNAPDAAFGERYSPDDTWAVYWYICGGKLETGRPAADGAGYENGGKASDDLEELLSVKLPENVTVVIETGGTKIWRTPELEIAADANSRYVYDSGGLRLIETLPQAAMNDETTVADFLSFCNVNYPADHKGVMFWDHGGGSVKGIIFDEYSGRSLKLPGLRAAFEKTSAISKESPPYEFVGIDACMMSTIDVAETLDGISRWMIASEASEPGCGWDYKYLDVFNSDEGLNGGHIGKAACDYFWKDCVDRGLEANVTMALIDLSNIDGLLSAYEKVGTELFSKVSADHGSFGALERAAMRSENYGGNSEWSGYFNMADLGDLTRNAEAAGLLEKYPEELYAALGDCVAYQVKGRAMSASGGLSCYYSYSGDKTEFDRFAALKDGHPFRWLYHYRLYCEMPADALEYMKSLEEKYGLPVLDATPLEAADAELDGTEIRLMMRDDREIAELGVGGGSAARLASVRVDLVKIGVNNGGETIFGTEYIVHDDWENGIYSKAFTGDWPAIGEAYLYLEIKERQDQDAVYEAPVLFGGERCSLDVAYYYESGEYAILGIHSVPDESGMATKDRRALAPGDVVEPLYLYKDIEGVRRWSSSGAVTITESTRVEPRRLPKGMYYLEFTMTDIRGNVFTSSEVKAIMDRG